MSQSRLTPADGSLPPELELAFSPLHKRAFGHAVGAACGLLIAGLTLIYVVRAGPGDLPEMALLRNYFAGYTPTVPGAAIGGPRLLQLGCHLAQGYGIARPMAAAELPAWMRQWAHDAPWKALAEPHET